MQLVQFTDFRNNASRYLDMVEHHGETIQILRSGKPVAQIIPQPSVSSETKKRFKSWQNRVWKPLPVKHNSDTGMSEILKSQRDAGL